MQTRTRCPSAPLDWSRESHAIRWSTRSVLSGILELGWIDSPDFNRQKSRVIARRGVVHPGHFQLPSRGK